MNDARSRVHAGTERLKKLGRVLYIDDDPDYAELFSKLMIRLGYSMLVCHDRDSATQVLLEIGDRCDYFISDCRLIGADGIELACEVARRYPGIAVGVISSCYEEMALRALKHGVPAAQKPEDRAGCRALIRRLDHHKAN